jgi:hypothetical protein
MPVGPYVRERIVLCSADAGPNSQRNEPDSAKYFFPGAKWVGALRNASERLECRFVILTTGHGMVNPDDQIGPYDMHIDEHYTHVEDSWNATVPLLLRAGQYDILVLYLGGCPRDPYLNLLLPILHRCNISCLKFGRSNTYDLGKVDQVVSLITTGTTTEELMSILRCPEALEFFPVERRH